MTQLTCTGAGRSAAAAEYTFPLLTLFGEVERLSASGDYSLTCGTSAETLPVEFVNNAGNVTISADTNWGSATADQRLLAVRVRGNLTIDAAKTLTTAARKLGLLIFCDGDLTVNGTLSMTARGANHSATGSNLTAFDTMLYEVSAAANNVWPAAGANGAASRTVQGGGFNGSAGANGQSGGGGSGGVRVSGTSGAGAAGTGYSGGPGGGGAREGVAIDGAARGGRGGDKGGISTGGAGNPGGGGILPSYLPGDDGTGGMVYVIALGDISIGAGGIISANGKNGGTVEIGTQPTGAGSGAGAISLYLYGSYTNSGTVQANGGSGGGNTYPGGAGGAGSIRVVAL